MDFLTELFNVTDDLLLNTIENSDKQKDTDNPFLRYAKEHPEEMEASLRNAKMPKNIPFFEELRRQQRLETAITQSFVKSNTLEHTYAHCIRFNKEELGGNTKEELEQAFETELTNVLNGLYDIYPEAYLNKTLKSYFANTIIFVNNTNIDFDFDVFITFYTTKRKADKEREYKMQKYEQLLKKAEEYNNVLNEINELKKDLNL